MHKLQPKHTKLNSKEVEQILAKLNVSLSQLPKISQKDFAVDEGAQTGDLLKIDRKTDLGDDVYYRVVA